MLFTMGHLSPACFCQRRCRRSRCRQRHTREWSSPRLVRRSPRSRFLVRRTVVVVEVVVVVVVVEAVVAVVAAVAAAAVVVEAVVVEVAAIWVVARWVVLVLVPELAAAVAVADRLL